MTTTRIFTFQLDPGAEDIAFQANRLQAVLDDWCERYWWYGGAEVRGAALGLLQFTVWVQGRSQWFTVVRMRRLAKAIQLQTGMEVCGVPADAVSRPPVHTNRGGSRRRPD